MTSVALVAIAKNEDL
jgi:hypothetical protein